MYHFADAGKTNPKRTQSKPNKANLLKAQMNVNKVLTKDYENISNCSLAENKANSKPNKANLLNDQMNVNKVLTRDYENKRLCRRGENKANTKPIQTQTKPTCRGVASGEAGSNPIPPPLLEQQINISKSSFYIYTSPGLYMRVVDFC